MPDKHVTKDQRDKFFSAVETSRNPKRNRAVFLLLHSFRVSEVCLVKLWEINPEFGQFYINGVPYSLHQKQIQGVRIWLPERAQMNLPRPVNTLFVSERRKPMSRETVWLFTRLTAEAAGLGNLSLHPEDLRHWPLD